ncbi:MAG: ABC transporter transmembrane domain-containing protein [Candidatus Firestonebacteria bacterium]|nr:ABC transporter transmembrane domain-containing protein [Candidatus Firestonebacteria bacterium]
MAIFRRILSFAKPYRSRLLTAVFFMAVVAACGGSSMYLLKPLFDEGFNKTNPEAAFATIKNIALILVAIYFVKGISFYIKDYLLNNAGQRIIMDIRNTVYEHVQNLSLDYFSRNKTGQILSRLTNDVVNMQNAVMSLTGIAGESMNFFGFLLIVFLMNWKLASLALLGILLVVYPIYNFGRRLRSISVDTQNKLGEITSIAHEGISNIRIVKAFAMEKYEHGKLAQANRSFFDTFMKAVRITAMSQPINEFIGIFAISILLLVAGYQISRGTLSVGEFIAFVGALFMLFNPIRNLNGVNIQIQQALSSAERIFQLLDSPQEVKDESRAVVMPVFEKEISYKNVAFEYTKDRPVLKNINLKIKKGEILAIVGPSGSGKSTLADLLPRFYDVNAGSIEIDGVDILKYKMSSLRTQIGIVTQETILFNDSIKGNIAYGRADIPMAQIESSARAANAHNFILRTQHGYDTLIGERGVKLSGGERQRLSIARAILKNPPILILDEATSALDTESEKLVQEALNNLMKDRTTIVIAHRLSTIINANKIVVLDKGIIAAEGGHEELLSSSPLYKKLYEMQFSATAKI